MAEKFNDKILNERARAYSLSKESQIYNNLTDAAQAKWKHEIEQAYLAGAIEMCDNPTGGALLSVLLKTKYRSHNAAIDDVLDIIESKALGGIHGGFCVALMKEIKEKCYGLK